MTYRRAPDVMPYGPGDIRQHPNCRCIIRPLVSPAVCRHPMVEQIEAGSRGNIVQCCICLNEWVEFHNEQT